MSIKLQWDQTGQRFFENGVSKGVLYPINAAGTGYDKGVAWNGLTTVTQSPSGAEVSPVYADNIKYLNLMSSEDFAATIEAYTYPDEFEACDGSANVKPGLKIGQQKRKKFAFCYQTKIGNDVDQDLGYKIHIIYGCLAAPSERSYETVNESPEAMTFSWEVSTTPVEVTGFKPTAHIEIDSRTVSESVLATIEAALYGTDDQTKITAIVAVVPGFTGDPTVLTPDQLAALFPAG